LSASGDVQKRERTRLWYRTEHAKPNEDVLISEQSTALIGEHGQRDEGGTLRERTGPLRSMAALQSVLAETTAESHDAALPANVEALTDWRDAPRHCPILLLSANPILDARAPGPLLGPGTKYRIVSVADGIVCLQVDALDGRIGIGYCNSVDLICYEPDILYLRGEKRTGRRSTARLNLSRISQRIAGVTGSLIG
jgi:hypothetical protein